MPRKEIHARTPVADTYRKKSPFAGLLEHMDKVKECVTILEEALVKYYRGDIDNFSDPANKISELEHEADLIKGNIRSHLPSSILMPVDKKYFIWLLRSRMPYLTMRKTLPSLWTCAVLWCP